MYSSQDKWIFIKKQKEQKKGNKAFFFQLYPNECFQEKEINKSQDNVLFIMPSIYSKKFMKQDEKKVNDKNDNIYHNNDNSPKSKKNNDFFFNPHEAIWYLLYKYNDKLTDVYNDRRRKKTVISFPKYHNTLSYKKCEKVDEEVDDDISRTLYAINDINNKDIINGIRRRKDLMTIKNNKQELYFLNCHRELWTTECKVLIRICSYLHKINIPIFCYFFSNDEQCLKEYLPKVFDCPIDYIEIPEKLKKQNQTKIQEKVIFHPEFCSSIHFYDLETLSYLQKYCSSLSLSVVPTKTVIILPTHNICHKTIDILKKEKINTGEFIIRWMIITQSTPREKIRSLLYSFENGQESIILITTPFLNDFCVFSKANVIIDTGIRIHYVEHKRCVYTSFCSHYEIERLLDNNNTHSTQKIHILLKKNILERTNDKTTKQNYEKDPHVFWEFLYSWKQKIKERHLFFTPQEMNDCLYFLERNFLLFYCPSSFYSSSCLLVEPPPQRYPSVFSTFQKIDALFETVYQPSWTKQKENPFSIEELALIQKLQSRCSSSDRTQYTPEVNFLLFSSIVIIHCFSRYGFPFSKQWFLTTCKLKKDLSYCNEELLIWTHVILEYMSQESVMDKKAFCCHYFLNVEKLDYIEKMVCYYYSSFFKKKKIPHYSILLSSFIYPKEQQKNDDKIYFKKYIPEYWQEQMRWFFLYKSMVPLIPMNLMEYKSYYYLYHKNVIFHFTEKEKRQYRFILVLLQKKNKEANVYYETCKISLFLFTPKSLHTFFLHLKYHVYLQSLERKKKNIIKHYYQSHVVDYFKNVISYAPFMVNHGNFC